MITTPLWVLSLLTFLIFALFCTTVYYHARTKYLEKAREVKKRNSARRAQEINRRSQLIEADIWGNQGNRDQLDRVTEHLRVINSTARNM